MVIITLMMMILGSFGLEQRAREFTTSERLTCAQYFWLKLFHINISYKYTLYMCSQKLYHILDEHSHLGWHSFFCWHHKGDWGWQSFALLAARPLQVWKHAKYNIIDELVKVVDFFTSHSSGMVSLYWKTHLAQMKGILHLQSSFWHICLVYHAWSNIKELAQRVGISKTHNIQ